MWKPFETKQISIPEKFLNFKLKADVVEFVDSEANAAYYQFPMDMGE